MSHLEEFDGKKLQSVAKGDLDLSKLGVEAPQVETHDSESLKPLLDAMTHALGERVKSVRISHRLTESPACLVVEEGDLSGNMSRFLKSVGQSVPTSTPPTGIADQLQGRDYGSGFWKQQQLGLKRLWCAIRYGKA